MINVHGLRRNVKNVVKNYSDAQVKVREATSNDPWGPSGTLMSEIADLTYNVVAFSEIMQVIWKRLNDHGKNWKHVYKALVLLEYLIKTGSEKVTQQCKENIFAIQTLKDFQYFEESKDQGVNVREKAKQLVALLKDDERLKNERARALKARERFARATSYVKQESAPRICNITAMPYGSSEFSQNSFDEDMLSPGALSLSELEHARPQTAGEEELQLQLALAMSKEEADQVERLKRNDDLRLQMALSESEEEFKKHKPDGAEDEPPSASAMEDLLGLSLNINQNSQNAMMDPWGLPLTQSKNSNSTDNIWNPSTVIPERNKNIDDVNNCGTGFSPTHNNVLESNAFDMMGMKKSISADTCTRPASQENSSSIDTFLSTDSSLINFDVAASRTRTLGNPFQAAKPSPLSINELRAQNGSQIFQASAENTLPTSASMPLQNMMYTNASYFSQNATPSQNPFK
ncbi:epsin-2-like isoform X2 [Uloborus diversus]|uniref:epsin-2-like isoform X2 n=1 Tax=Uloborus diversus TaxID=327109 RepID=UPI00240A9908|nr:epsin-2-like isoform X2 [Uloborus diversus]